MTNAKKANALRMIRHGWGVADIASVCGVPRREVRELMKPAEPRESVDPIRRAADELIAMGYDEGLVRANFG